MRAHIDFIKKTIRCCREFNRRQEQFDAQAPEEADPALEFELMADCGESRMGYRLQSKIIWKGVLLLYS